MWLLKLGDPQIIQVIRKFKYWNNHGDLGIPHDLRNVHIPIMY